LAGGWIYFSFFKSKKISSLAVNFQNILEDISKKAGEIDSDADGLKDWEEVLWGTNINNPDTDKDSYSDKEETNAGYDPLDPLSNEKTGKKNEPKEFIVPDISDSINFTDEIARNASNQIIKGLAYGGEPDISSALDIMNQGITQDLAEFIASFYTRISEKELKVSYDNKWPSIQKYYADVNKIVFNESYVMNPWINSETIFPMIQAENFLFADEIIDRFEKTINNAKEIVVPSDFLQIHKKGVELLMAEKKIFETIKEINKDPFKTLLGMQEGEKIIKELGDLFVQFNNMVETYRE